MAKAELSLSYYQKITNSFTIKDIIFNSLHVDKLNYKLLFIEFYLI